MHKNFRYNTEMIPPSPSFCLFISLSFHFAVPFQIRIASFLLFTGMSSRDQLCCSRPEGCSQPAEEEKEEKMMEEKDKIQCHANITEIACFFTFPCLWWLMGGEDDGGVYGEGDEGGGGGGDDGHLTAASNVLFQSSPQSLHLGSQLFSNLHIGLWSSATYMLKNWKQ